MNLEKILDVLNRIEFDENTEDMLFEMANVRPNESGLPVVIYISTGYVEGKLLNHGPRIKVSNSYSHKFDVRNTFVVTISEYPVVKGTCNIKDEDLDLVKQFIIKNKDILEAYWEDDISTLDMLHGLQRVT
jgi:hypothetical protein